jgi:ParB family chromosome partitioning protein
LEIVKQNGSVDNAEYQSIKKLSEERAAEAKKYKEELDSAMKQISEKNDTVKFLEEKLTKLEQTPPASGTKSREDLEEELKYITEAKNKAEKERAKLETNIEKLKQQQKEKEERKITLTDVELKKITSLAKAEQALNLFETNFDVLKNNKSIIKNDPNLKVRVEILRSRLNDFIDSLDV